jgi:hypothetical protein
MMAVSIIMRKLKGPRTTQPLSQWLVVLDITLASFLSQWLVVLDITLSMSGGIVLQRHPAEAGLLDNLVSVLPSSLILFSLFISILKAN